jgi:hypothetical protein
MHFLRILGYWLVLLAVAIANGAFGDLVVARWLGEYSVHLYKTLVMVMVIFMMARIYAKHVRKARWLQDVVECGLIWVLLSVTFEFIFGHYVLGNIWEDLLSDYNLLQGRLWSLVLFSDFLAPLLMGWRYKGK